MARYCPICGEKQTDWTEDFSYVAYSTGLYPIIISCEKCKIVATVVQRYDKDGKLV